MLNKSVYRPDHLFKAVTGVRGSCPYKAHVPKDLQDRLLTMVLSKGGGQLPSKCRYGCAANAKSRSGKISQKNLMSGQKNAQKPNN